MSFPLGKPGLMTFYQKMSPTALFPLLSPFPSAECFGTSLIKLDWTLSSARACWYGKGSSSHLVRVLQVYSGAHGRAMVFTSTKNEANEMALNSDLKQDCQVLHGDIPQKQREITLKVCGAVLTNFTKHISSQYELGLQYQKEY